MKNFFVCRRPERNRQSRLSALGAYFFSVHEARGPVAPLPRGWANQADGVAPAAWRPRSGPEDLNILPDFPFTNSLQRVASGHRSHFPFSGVPAFSGRRPPKSGRGSQRRPLVRKQENSVALLTAEASNDWALDHEISKPAIISQ
jgi:hypothetical protein